MKYCGERKRKIFYLHIGIINVYFYCKILIIKRKRRVKHKGQTQMRLKFHHT